MKGIIVGLAAALLLSWLVFGVLWLDAADAKSERTAVGYDKGYEEGAAYGSRRMRDHVCHAWATERQSAGGDTADWSGNTHLCRNYRNPNDPNWR